MKPKKIILKRRKTNNPGPKPKPKAELARNQNVSFPVEMHKFICLQSGFSEYIQKRVKLDTDYQKYLKTL